ncbi:ABC transporter permease [Salinibacterium sp. dk2585]|uniref:ABC transporter permease n=1 Tax=unclassified Salinibacterium TaxID=2632331 RepID=UPI0011C2569D|nr:MULTISPECIES: ABC transporter permease [unclassified Salinibacterium]QEE61788.1 ABC transporter permease [Salinibacterium sp. dk2585]TXK54657.1 ABC transporter permease [Salinibacterium sp. dk5596]
MRFTGALRSEFTKLTTTRMWWVLALILAVYVAFTAGALGAAFGGLFPGAQDAGGLDGLHELVYSVAVTVGYVFPVILGTLSVTGEVRHQTLTPTFLATPRRGTVLAAKLVTLFCFGIFYGVVALAASVAVGAPLLAAGDMVTGLDDSQTWLMFGRAVLAMGIWAIIGVGLGTLIPNQIAAIVVLLAFTQFVEPILRTVGMLVEGFAEIGRFLPGAAGDALVGSSVFAVMSGPSSGALLEWWQGGLVLLAFAAVAATIGAVTTWRRDVT